MIGLGSIERCLGNDLANQGRTQTGLSQFHSGSAHFLVAGDEGTDADTTLAVTLRYTVDHDDVVLDTLEMHGAGVGRIAVDELAVNLVGKQEQVIFLHQVTQAHQLLAAVQRASGVVGVTDHDGAGALVDDLLKLLDGRQCETILDVGGDGADYGTGLAGKTHVVGIGGLGNDDLVTRIQAYHEGHLHGLAATAGNDDIVNAQVDVVALVVTYQFLHITGNTL